MLNDPTNGQLPLVAELRGPLQVDPAIIASFGEDEEDAVKLAIRWSWDHRRIAGLTKTRFAELCGFKNSHLTNILQGGKYLPAQRINVWESILGNTAVSQTIARFAELRQRQLREEISLLVAEHLVPLQQAGVDRERESETARLRHRL
jgi:hypothetical protein